MKIIKADIKKLSNSSTTTTTTRPTGVDSEEVKLLIDKRLDDETEKLKRCTNLMVYKINFSETPY